MCSNDIPKIFILEGQDKLHQILIIRYHTVYRVSF